MIHAALELLSSAWTIAPQTVSAIGASGLSDTFLAQTPAISNGKSLIGHELGQLVLVGEEIAPGKRNTFLVVDRCQHPLD